MKITKITAIPKNFELSTPFAFASCTLTHLPYAWVQIQTDENITGYGECPAYWDPSGETQESAIGAIRFISGALLDKSPFQLEEIMKICDDNTYGAYSAKCGIDMALYDIIGKKLNVPVYEVLGGKNYDVKVNAVLGLSDPKEAARKCEEFVKQNYEYIKVKVGRNLDTETKVLRTLNSILSGKSKLFVDANQGWGTAKNALRAIKQLEEFDLAWIEQPVKAFDWQGLKYLREQVATPIMADESLYTYQDAFKMAKDEIADMFNIKLAKSGGLYFASKIKSIADAANIPCVLGSMIESTLGMLADYHFARAKKMESCGLSAYKLILNQPDVGLRLDGNKLVIDDERPGLGYQDESVFENEFK